MTNLILKDESDQIIGKCFEVHNQLGPGFLEVVYKDTLELEFQQAGIPYEREKEYSIIYKGNLLRRKYYADFVIFDSIILEIKAVSGITDDFVARCINYLKQSIRLIGQNGFSRPEGLFDLPEPASARQIARLVHPPNQRRGIVQKYRCKPLPVSARPRQAHPDPSAVYRSDLMNN